MKRCRKLNDKTVAWLSDPLPADVRLSINRIAQLEDVEHVAIMPDVHLANQVCVGTVLATKELIYPEAIGGDIGCGIATVALDADAELLGKESAAAAVLASLYESVPINKHRCGHGVESDIFGVELSSNRLNNLSRRDGHVQLGTLGRGNHFLELQADEDDRLWIMVHSGSRGMGQAISSFHMTMQRKEVEAGASPILVAFDPVESSGQSYLRDAEWAIEYAAENRRTMLRACDRLFDELFSVRADWTTLIHTNHNHVSRESHFGKEVWVHRKGAQPASEDQIGTIPGSMGTASFHVIGRGCQESLNSSSHGAGRKLSRHEARKSISAASTRKQLESVWIDQRNLRAMREESPAAYKDIRAVMRSQRELTRITREVRPVLSYKGR